ncbi:MAG: serine hydrolase domain-containing protein, partial [Flavisolibacter sp.]
MKKITASVTFILLTLQLLAQTNEQKMDALVSAFVAQSQFNGTVLVGHKNNIIFQKGYGVRNTGNRVPNDVNSIYQIGSLTKQFTAAIIMQLHQENKLGLQDKLSKYFTGFTNGDKITIEHLLTHTSGLFNYTNDSVVMHGDLTEHYSEEDFLKKFRAYPSDFAPGTDWNYSNTGYVILGYIIGKVEKKPYEKVVRQRILRPLGMINSGFDFSHLTHANKTTGYFFIHEGGKQSPVVDSTISHAAGALYSTVGDLYKWERAISANKILSAASWKKVFTPFKSKYGYGWNIDSVFEKPITHHSGGIHGYVSYILRFPTEDLAVIIIDNSSS